MDGVVVVAPKGDAVAPNGDAGGAVAPNPVVPPKANLNKSKK